LGHDHCCLGGSIERNCNQWIQRAIYLSYLWWACVNISRDGYNPIWASTIRSPPDPSSPGSMLGLAWESHMMCSDRLEIVTIWGIQDRLGSKWSEGRLCSDQIVAAQWMLRATSGFVNMTRRFHASLLMFKVWCTNCFRTALLRLSLFETLTFSEDK